MKLKVKKSFKPQFSNNDLDLFLLLIMPHILLIFITQYIESISLQYHQSIIICLKILCILDDYLCFRYLHFVNALHELLVQYLRSYIFTNCYIKLSSIIERQSHNTTIVNWSFRVFSKGIFLWSILKGSLILWWGS